MATLHERIGTSHVPNLSELCIDGWVFNMSELFSTGEFARMYDKWLPGEAGTSCLSLLRYLNGIIAHWNCLDKVDPNSFFDCARGCEEEPGPNPSPIQVCQIVIGKHEWLHVRLPELLKELGLPEEMAAFLSGIVGLDGHSLSGVSNGRLAQIARDLNSRIIEGLEELKFSLSRYGYENELPEGWQLTGSDKYLVGTYPVRDIRELITYLKSRSIYIRRMDSESSYLLKSELLNATLAVQEMIRNPERWPRHEYDTNSFSQSQLRLDQMIHELSVIEAEDIRAMAKKVTGADSSSVTSSTPNVAVSLDEDRLRFNEACKAKNPRLKQLDIAKMWCKEKKDYCDLAAFKQSIYRARLDRKK